MRSFYETNSLSLLSDKHLIDCYLKSLELEMDAAFIELLETEMERRKISIEFAKFAQKTYVIS